MTDERHYTVGQVADWAGVTVRTLHHYDHIGLVRPSERSFTGYRLYTEADLQRLQHVLIYRRLGFTLRDVAELLEGTTDVVAHLQRQRESVTQQVDELNQLVALIDQTLEAQMTNRTYTISDTEMKAIFGDVFDDSHHREAHERWGNTPEWRESVAKTRGYSAEDWRQIKAENDDITHRFTDLMTRGVPASSPEAMSVAEELRQHMCHRYFTCSKELHAQIAELNVCDERFAKLYEDVAGGLATYVRDAVVANSTR